MTLVTIMYLIKTNLNKKTNSDSKLMVFTAMRQQVFLKENKTQLEKKHSGQMSGRITQLLQ